MLTLSASHHSNTKEINRVEVSDSLSLDRATVPMNKAYTRVDVEYHIVNVLLPASLWIRNEFNTGVAESNYLKFYCIYNTSESSLIQSTHCSTNSFTSFNQSNYAKVQSSNYQLKTEMWCLEVLVIGTYKTRNALVQTRTNSNAWWESRRLWTQVELEIMKTKSYMGSHTA